MHLKTDAFDRYSTLSLTEVFFTIYAPCATLLPISSAKRGKCFAVTCCDFILIHGWIALTQLLNKRTFIVGLKSMDFVAQNDATEVGNNLPRCKNVLQAMVSNRFM